jgi:hypothetical protein
MINNFRTYNYFTFGTDNGYGQKELSAFPSGTIKISIFLTNKSIQDNINYTGANYIGLTHANANDNMVIEYKGKKLKVLYVNSEGRINQVFLSEI